MRSKVQHLWLFVLFLSCLTAHAEPGRGGKNATTAISISCVCHDAVGQAYVAAVKDLLNKDSHFEQMEGEEGARHDAIRVHIMSLPIDTADGKPRAALSIVYTHDGNMVQQLIETCAHIPLTDCAQNMIRDLKELESSL